MPPSQALNADAGGLENLADQSSRLWLWLTNQALPTWWRLGADRAGGGYFETLDRDGAASTAPRRCRVTPRQIYAFALAGDAGWTGPAVEATEHGLDFLLRNFRRADGLFRTAVWPDGLALDDSAFLYDQAFVLLGLYGAHTLRPRAALRDVAENHLGCILQHFKYAEGGFREAGLATFQSNAQMHLFEACIAWAPVLGGLFTHTADELGALCLDRLIDPKHGCIDEYYDAHWRPSAERRIEPGHQFEWAWLLSQWARTAGRDVGVEVDRLFRIGEASVLPAVDAAPAAVSADGALIEPLARLWPQTERLRTAAFLADAARTDHAIYERAAVKAATSLLHYLETPLPGLWWDKLRPDGTFVDEPAPASSLYHLATAIVALKRLVLDPTPSAAILGADLDETQ